MKKFLSIAAFVGLMAGLSAQLTPVSPTPLPDFQLAALNAMGFAIKGQPVGMLVGTMNNSTGLSNQQAVYTAIYVPVSSVITGVKFWIHTQGSYTGNNFNGVALYSYAGGALTQIAISSNASTNWTTPTSGSMGTVPFTTPVSVPAGLYYVGALYCESAQTTAPVLGLNGGLIDTAISQIGTNSSVLCGTWAAQTTLPATLNCSSLTPATIRWFALY